ncbi:uncharacterized protein IAS62_005043 [Cryptococcus decagattii]|uniref:Secreted protein n=1 Tax=Cryptococcus decagattii TaxID=1859122 RepID=A0ABZ2B2K4_9TREE
MLPLSSLFFYLELLLAIFLSLSFSPFWARFFFQFPYCVCGSLCYTHSTISTTKSEQLLQRSTGSFIAKQLRIVIDGVFAKSWSFLYNLRTSVFICCNRVVSHPPVLLKDHPASVF